MTKIKHYAVTQLPSSAETGAIYLTSEGSQYIGTSANTFKEISNVLFVEKLPQFGNPNKLYILSGSEYDKMYRFDGTNWITISSTGGGTVVESSLTNGNIKVDDTEVEVYRHPTTHSPSEITTDANNRFVTDEQISAWNSNTTTKLVRYSYNLKAESDNQVEFEIPLLTFDINTDYLTIYQNSIFLNNNNYSINDRIIQLNEGVLFGTVISITIIKYIPIGDSDGYLSGNILTDGSVSLSKLKNNIFASASDWGNYKKYFKNELIVKDGNLYRALIEHTSSDNFIDDMILGLEKWESLTPHTTGSIQQATITNVIASAVSPHHENIVIPYTNDFKRSSIEVLQYNAGELDKISSINTFYNSNTFEQNNQLLFDGKLQLKTNYDNEMLYVKDIGNGKLYSHELNLSKYKNIENMPISKTVLREMNKYGVAWFKFDEASGNVTDSKGTAVGTVTGATRVTGVSGKALNFNGSSYVQFNSKVVPIGKKSIRFKIKTNQMGGRILSHIESATNNGEAIGVFTDGTIWWRIFNGGSAIIDIKSTVTVVDNEWHDILLTWDGTKSTGGVKIYIDNMNTPSNTGTATNLETSTQSRNFTIGAIWNGTAYSAYFIGQIDELEIYNNVINSSADKTLILSDYEYKKYDKANSRWVSVSNAEPSESDFINYGMSEITLTSTELNKLADSDEMISFVTYTTLTTPPNLSHTSIPESQIAIQAIDSNISDVNTIKRLSMTSSTSGNGLIKSALSFNQGLNWYTWDSVNSNFIEIQLNTSELYRNGIHPSTLNTVTSEKWNILKGESNTVRFAHLLNVDSLTDIANIDIVKLQYDSFGTWKHYKDAEWEYKSNNSLQVSVYENGKYKINY